MNKNKNHNRNNKNQSTGNKSKNYNTGNKPATRSRKGADKTWAGDLNPNMGAETSNNPQWYSKNPQLNKDSASFNFSMALGLPVDLSSHGAAATPFVIPGIMAIDYVPGIGWCDGESSHPTTVDLAANSLYSFVVHANSRTKLYDAPDYMMYCLAGVDMYAAYADMVRAYGIARWYNSYNRYYPAKVLSALGYNLEEIVSNMANFRYQLNRFAVALTSINIPNKLPIYSRQTWLPQNIFMDHPGMKSQSYAFVPKIVHKYEGYESAKGGYLHGIEWKGLSLAEKLSTFTVMLNTLLADQDIGIMSGDTLKAFGSENLLHVNMIGEDYTTIPVYDEVVLMQIENLTVCGGIPKGLPASEDVPAINTLYDIWQDPALGNRIFYTPTMLASVSNVVYSTFNKIINVRHDNPSVDDMFEATRLTTMSDVNYSSYASIEDDCEIPLKCIGTEIVVNLDVIDMDTKTEYSDNTVGKGAFALNALSHIYSFRYHPIMLWNETRTAPDTVVGLHPVVDYANYTILDLKELTNMHNTALLSQFGIPFLGQTTK